MPYELSTEKVCILGFEAAGWSDLIKQETAENKKVLSYWTGILDDENSLYYQYYHKRAIDPIKSTFIDVTVAQELLENYETVLDINEKNELIDVYNFLAQQESLHLPHLKEDETLAQVLKSESISPYDFFKMITSINYPHGKDKDRKQAEYKIKSKDQNFQKKKQVYDRLLKRVSATYKYINLNLKNIIEAEDNETRQIVAWQSKRVITDIFQENLRRYRDGKPLIPIKITIATEIEEKKFVSNTEKVKNKSDVFYTSAEMRMIYKLMHEVGDPTARDIMQNTVTFWKETQDSRVPFEQIDSP